MPVDVGSVTLRAAAVAMAASAALPPRISIERPACEASGWLEATMPRRARTGERYELKSGSFGMRKSVDRVPTMVNSLIDGLVDCGKLALMSCSPTLPCSDILAQLLIIGLTNGSVIALNAIGFTLIYGITRTINLAHGDLFALS